MIMMNMHKDVWKCAQQCSAVCDIFFVFVCGLEFLLRELFCLLIFLAYNVKISLLFNQQHDIRFNNNINGKYWSQLSLCCARGFNFKLHPIDISDPFPIPTFVLSVDAQVGCLPLYTNCPTYDAECSIVHLPDSKRFSRLGLDVVQQDVFRPGG